MRLRFTFLTTALFGVPATALLFGSAAPVSAQDPTPSPITVDSSLVQESAPDDWPPLRVAKWSTAALAAGTAAYGFVSNQRADERFEELEQVCVSEPLRCATLLPNGEYADAALEAEYQEVRRMDRRARTALIVGQIGVAASVVLFILDLRNSAGPENIPYEPRRIDIMPARDGGVSLRMNVRW